MLSRGTPECPLAAMRSMTVQAQCQPVSGRYIVLCKMVMNIGDVALCRVSDIQGFWRDR
jgi:hypothetical protein